MHCFGRRRLSFKKDNKKGKKKGVKKEGKKGRKKRKKNEKEDKKGTGPWLWGGRTPK
jgi:hypothetical protein